MSTLFAVTTTVTPQVTPQVVQYVQYVTPEWVNHLAEVLKQLAILGLLVVPGWTASWLQQVINSSKDGFKRLSSTVNVLLLFGYSIVLGLLGLVATDQLNLVNIDFTNPAQVGTAILTVLGAAAFRYNRSNKLGDDSEVAATSETQAQY